MKNLESLYNHIQPKVYAFFYVKTKDKELSEDLTQEVFYEALKSYNSFKGNSSLQTWVFSIANNLLKKEFRKKKYTKNLTHELSMDSLNHCNLEDEFIEKYEKATLLNLINNLEDTPKEIVILRIYGELSFQEIGTLLNISENYARVNFHRTKLKLQKELKKYDG